MPTTVSTIAELNAAIAAANADAANFGVITIDLSGTISLSGTALTAITLAAGTTLDVEGHGGALDGGGTRPGLYVAAGTVDITGLAIANMAVAGGFGFGGGGGGGGLGGGLFLASGSSVTLTGVSFTGDRASGGDGGGSSNSVSGGSGGSGGGESGSGYGGRGGGGLGAGGDIFVQQGASLTIAGVSDIAAGNVTGGGQ